MELMKHDPKVRCIMSLSYRDDILDIMEEVGMTAVSVEMPKDKIAEATAKAIKTAGKIPDAIVDKGSKKDRIIRLIARNPELMMEKLDNIL